MGPCGHLWLRFESFFFSVSTTKILQGSHFSGLTKFPDFSLTFPVFFAIFPVFLLVFFKLKT